MSVSPQFFSELEIRQFLAMAGYTVLVYDYLLTFDLETDYIWRARWSGVKVLFLLNRYGTLFGQTFLLLEELGILSRGSRKFCEKFEWFQSFFALFSSEITRTLLLLRARALWRCSYRVAVSLVSVYVLYVLMRSAYSSYIMFKHDHYFHFPYLEKTGVCVVSATVANVWLGGLISLLLDTSISAVIAYYLYRLCRDSLQFQRSPLIRLLVRDAVLFYLVNVFHDVLGVLALSTFVHNPLYNVQVVFAFPLLTIAGQRAILNLRGFQSKPYTTHDIDRTVDRQIAALWQRSFWQSVDLWMSDVHQELGTNGEPTSRRAARAMELQTITEEGSSYELQVIRTRTSIDSRHVPPALDPALYDSLVDKP